MKHLFSRSVLRNSPPLPSRERVGVRGYFTKSILIGSGFALGLFAVTVLAVTVGTVKTWTSGETLTSSDLNSTISSLKTALEGIPNWTKSGTDAVYTDGNVGIGTTNVEGAIHIGSHGAQWSGSNYGTNLILKGGSPARNPAIGIFDSNGADPWAIANAGGNLTFSKMPALGDLTSPPARYLVIANSTGNVGIGTTNPEGVLSVYSNSGASGAWIYLNGNVSGANPSTSFNRALAVGWNRSNGQGETNLVFGTGGGTAPRLEIAEWNGSAYNTVLVAKSGGNIGIGTTTPSYPLHMASGAYVSTGGVWTNASSREYKENMRDLSGEEALSAVMALEPQKFSYKADGADCVPGSARFYTGRGSSGMKPDATNRKPSPLYEVVDPPSAFRSAGGGEGVPSPRRGEGKGEESPCTPEQYVGFIAEDVPDLVATNDRKGLSAMDLVAVLTKVVQTQQREIEELQRRISNRKIQ